MPDSATQSRFPNPSAKVDAQTGTTVTVDAEDIVDFLDTIEAAKMLPSMEVLEKMAAQSPPPPEWFDEEI